MQTPCTESDKPGIDGAQGAACQEIIDSLDPDPDVELREIRASSAGSRDVLGRCGIPLAPMHAYLGILPFDWRCRLKSARKAS